MSWMALTFALAGLAIGLKLRQMWLRHRRLIEERRYLQKQLDEVPKLDIRKPHEARITACRLCSVPIRQHPAMVNDKCDDCRAAEFEASEEKDRRGWEKGGEIIKRDWS